MAPGLDDGDAGVGEAAPQLRLEAAQALLVVADLYGDDSARLTAMYMEYPFPDDNRRRI